MSKPSTTQADPVVQGLSDIKKLLILDLLTRGVQPNQIARILGMDAGGFSRAYPMRKLLKKPRTTK